MAWGWPVHGIKDPEGRAPARVGTRRVQSGHRLPPRVRPDQERKIGKDAGVSQDRTTGSAAAPQKEKSRGRDTGNPAWGAWILREQ